jgi:Zn finger protein HypA/HybF involved in hydrogenase expression
MIDGNGLAGLLTELLGTEATTLERRCQSCSDVHPLGAHRAFQGAAWVLRCPGCSAVAAMIAADDAEVRVEWAGVLRIPRRNG